VHPRLSFQGADGKGAGTTVYRLLNYGFFKHLLVFLGTTELLFLTTVEYLAGHPTTQHHSFIVYLANRRFRSCRRATTVKFADSIFMTPGPLIGGPPKAIADAFRRVDRPDSHTAIRADREFGKHAQILVGK
jgi:hypothetical protein